jgi:gluconokinase
MIVVVMGVAGTGKSTVGKRLAASLHLPFIEGDAFHSAANIEKMSHGEPLTAEDRAPWLDRINRELRRHDSAGAVLACSALTESSRRRLTKGVAGVRFVLLRGDEDVLRARLKARKGHFAGANLLASQLATLEEPDDAVVVDVDAPPDEVFARALSGLQD